jgi:GWxTD domain-containing protein
MKAKIFLSLALILIFGTMSGQKLRAYLNYATFDTPDNLPYLETYLNVDGQSIGYHQLENGNWQGQVNIQVIFTRNDSIIDYAKYSLFGPEAIDTNHAVNMIDVQRYQLSTGNYKMHLTLSDNYRPADTVSSTVEIGIYFPENEMAFSDIELLSSFKEGGSGAMVKNGYTLVPFVFNYFPENENQLSFYVELYKSNKVLTDQPFLLNYYIRPFEVDKKMDQYYRMKKANPESVNVLMPSFDISQLPSGNYLLMVEARDQSNKLLTQKELYFQRYNPNLEFNLNSLLVLNTQNSFVGNIANRDTLLQYIQYLYPISTEIEKLYVQNQLITADLTTLQKYFLNFWIERNKTNPEKAWNDYLTLVNQANHDFKTVSGPGYQSDRGRVYLQYGQPSVISQNYNEPAAYPYEIWQYYQLGNQRDKKFVFYTHDMVTNDFQLIHSNAIGELNNYRWQTIIYRRTWDPNSIDDEFIPDTWGSGATQNYLQPGSR